MFDATNRFLLSLVFNDAAAVTLGVRLDAWKIQIDARSTPPSDLAYMLRFRVIAMDCWYICLRVLSVEYKRFS